MLPSRWARHGWRAAGLASVVLGTVGIALPLLPSVPFYILAAFCFGRSNPEWEARLLRHPRFGPPILAWRTRGAISRAGKLGAVLALSLSAVGGLLFLADPWRWAPLAVAMVTGTWLVTRPDA